MNFFDKILKLFSRRITALPESADAPATAAPAVGSEALRKMSQALKRQKYMEEACGTIFRASPRTSIHTGNIIGGTPINDNIPATIVVDDSLSGRRIMTKKGIWGYNLLDEMISFGHDGSISAPAPGERTVIISIRTPRSLIYFVIVPDTGINTGDIFMNFRISISITGIDGIIQTTDKYVLFEKNPEDGRFEAMKALSGQKKIESDAGESMEIARNLIADGKHALAISELKSTYQSIKKEIVRRGAPDSIKTLLANVSNMLGTCYGARNLWDAALFYRVLDTNLRPDNAPAQGALDEAMIKARDIRALATYSSDFLASNEALSVPLHPVSPLGSVLEMCFDISPSDITVMTCFFDSPSVATLNVPACEIADFEFRVCASRFGSFTAVAARGGSGSNAVVMRMERHQGYVRLSVFAPEFNTSATGGFSRTLSLDYSTSPYISRANFNDLRARIAEKKDDSEAVLSTMEREILISDADAAYHLFCARAAWDRKLWGDVLFHFLKAYRLLAPKDIIGRADELVRSIIIDLNYRLGYVLVELKCYEQAISFLERNVPTNKIIYHTEFLNALVNSSDPRALSVLNMFRRMLSEEKYDAPPRALRDFVFFLDRQYVCILIDTGDIHSARAYLRCILDSPLSNAEIREFAKGELKYLDEQFNSNS